jgi:hypothetical protein
VLDVEEGGQQGGIYSSVGVTKIVEHAILEGNSNDVRSLRETTMVLPRAKTMNTEVFSSHVLFLG